MSKRATTLTRRIRSSHLGEALRLYRTVNRWSLRDLATKTQISSATLMRIEHGEAYDVETFMRLWKWLSTHPAAPREEQL